MRELMVSLGAVVAVCVSVLVLVRLAVWVLERPRVEIDAGDLIRAVKASGYSDPTRPHLRVVK